MRIITKKRLNEFALRHPQARSALESWHDLTERATWRSLMEVRRTYPQADGVRVHSGKTATIFNISGNAFRLVTAIHYDSGKVFVMRFLTCRVQQG